MPLLLAADLQAGGNKLFVPTFANQASFPTAATSENSLAYATDVNTLHYSDGSSWLQLAVLTADLAALENLSTTGIAVRTGTSTWTTRSIAVTTGADSSAALAIGNADGVSGNPTISISTNNDTFKLSVECATTANITLSGTQTIDGISVSVGNRVLVKNQTTASANGIYTVAAGAWTRSVDYDSSIKAENGLFVFVRQGTTNGGSYWMVDQTMPTIGTTSLSFTRLSILPSGTTDQTLRHNGTTWVATSVLTTGTGGITVTGTLNVSSVTGTPTTIIGRDGSGNVGTVSLGTGLSISSGTLTLGTTFSGGTSNKLAVWQSGTVISANVNFSCDNVNDRIGIGSGATSPVTRLHVAGNGGFGDSITVSNAIRALNLNSTDAVMRILRISADSTTAAPAIEIMHRTSADGTNTLYYDLYADSNGLKIRDRAASDAVRMTLNGSGQFGFGTTPDANYRIIASAAIRANGTLHAQGVGNSFTGDFATAHLRLTNTTAVTGDTWYIGSRNDGGLDIQSGNLTQVARFNAGSGRFDLYYSWGLTGFANSASLSANQNNYDISDAGAAAVHRLTSTTPINITGMVGGVAGRVVTLINIGANTITLTNEDANSTAANRFALGANTAITASQAITLWYDTTSSRWRPTAGSGGGSSGAPVGAQYLTLATDATLTNERVFTAGANVVVSDGGAGGNYTVAVGTQTFGLTGIISPTGTTGTVNNYNPTSLSTASIIRQTTTAATTITGLSGGSSGRIILFFNIGTHDIEFLNESASSTAANRFAMGTDFKLAPNKSTQFWYDSTSSRWRVVGVEDDAATRVSILAKTANYTLANYDNGKFITMDSTSNITLTIPTNATVAFPVGTVITVVRTNTGKVNIAGSGGVTVNSADGDLYLRSRYSAATLTKTATDTWLVTGDLTAT